MWADKLLYMGHRLATAESCTGGGLGRAITAVSGISQVYLGGVIAYHNDIKYQFLQVPMECLSEHGAVSEPVARAMADGVRLGFDAQWGLSTTGVAGPGGGSDDKPVGLVWMAIAGPDGVSAESRVFAGDREAIRLAACDQILAMFARRLEQLSPA